LIATIAKPSPIHGLGLFAARDIAVGETILDWTQCQEPLTEDAVQKLDAEQRKRVSIIGAKMILFKPPACWINHSCEPNARGENGRDFALREIRQGEEITVDYIHEKVPNLNLSCNCGAGSCRRVLRSV
jgi:SET domain-containing protein